MDFHWLSYLIIIVCLVLSAFFASTESSFLALDEMKLKKIEDKNVKRTIKEMLKDVPRLLITILLGNTIANTLASSLLEKNLELGNPILSTIAVASIILVIGEITPKTIAIMRSEQVAMFNAPFIHAIAHLLQPLSFVLKYFSLFFENIGMRLHRKKESADMDKDHLPALLSIVTREEIFDKEERTLIERVLKFASREVWNIMTPRTKVVSIEQEKSIDDLILALKKTKFSKLPIHKSTNDNIVGVVYLRAVFPYIHSPEKRKNKKVKDIMDSMYFVPETKKLSEMLEDFRKKRIRIASVVDEYGYSLGIVTIADVLGEIVGELMDESFKIDRSIVKVQKNRYLVNGDLSLDDFNAYFKTGLASGEYETIAGYVIDKSGDIPEKGFTMDAGKYKLIVMEKSEKHIESFIVEKSKRSK